MNPTVEGRFLRTGYINKTTRNSLNNHFVDADYMLIVKMIIPINGKALVRGSVVLNLGRGLYYES